ncbi:MAG: nucleotidyltransferase family protein [Proteobacteria bacterium]|nr:nucleotidyltransferase family protein [Pseudomonadota bacterium]
MITGIILASGFSKRMARDKLLLEIGGMPVVERVVRAAKSSLLDDIILVYQNNRVKEIGKQYGVRTVYNDSAHEGQSAAVKLGVRESRPDTDAFMFLVGDQPFLDPATINTLIECHASNPKDIIIPVYDGKRGNPAIFPSIFRDDLLAIEGDIGGRVLIEKMGERVKLVAIENSIANIDIDTQEDYERIKSQ